MDYEGTSKAAGDAQTFERQIKKQKREIKELKRVMQTMHRHSSREARAAAAKKDQDEIDTFFKDESDESMDESE